MKKCLVSVVALLLPGVILCACSGTGGGLPARGVVVRSWVAGVPTVTVTHRAPNDMNDFSKFATICSGDWREKYDLFSAALVRKAAECRLNSSSLAAAFKAVLAAPESNGLALLPVAAYSTQYQGDDVWRIDLRWEAAGGPRLDEPMGHARSYYFTRDAIRQVGFVTCE